MHIMGVDDIIKKFGQQEAAMPINIEPYYVDVSVDVGKEPTISSIGDVSILTTGNLSVITGKAKSRKTFLASGIAASMLSGDCLGVSTDEPAPVLFLDTEQSLHKVHHITKRILRLAGLDPARNNPLLSVYFLKPLSPKERTEILKVAIDKHKPKLIIIDGVRDLLYDFNSISESFEIVNLLMRLSVDFQCHIMSIIHTNKGNGELRGHAGAELLNKAETVFEVSTLENISTVKAIATRGMQPQDVYFSVGESGLPFLVGQPTKADAQLDQKKSIIRRLMGQSSMTYAQLWSEYAQLSGVSERTSKRHIAEMLGAGVINKDNNGIYRLKNALDYDDLPD